MWRLCADQKQTRQPDLCRDLRPTKASVDYAFFARKTTARQLLSECVLVFPYVHNPGLQRRGFGLFFQYAHDCIHVNLQHAGRITDATAIKGHIDDLFFDAGLVGAVGIQELKTAATGFTFVALVGISTDSFTPDFILVAAVATRNSDSYHVIKTRSPYLGHDQKTYYQEHAK